MKLLTLYAIKATEHGGCKAEMELLGLGTIHIILPTDTQHCAVRMEWIYIVKII